MRAFCCFFLLLVSVLPSNSQDAPFGLTWGISQEETLNLGATLTEIPGEGFGKSFAASGLKKLYDVAEIQLFLVTTSFGAS
jgi:hypothetical protein